MIEFNKAYIVKEDQIPQIAEEMKKHLATHRGYLLSEYQQVDDRTIFTVIYHFDNRNSVSSIKRRLYCNLLAYNQRIAIMLSMKEHYISIEVKNNDIKEVDDEKI